MDIFVSFLLHWDLDWSVWAKPVFRGKKYWSDIHVYGNSKCICIFTPNFRCIWCEMLCLFWLSMQETRKSKLIPFMEFFKNDICHKMFLITTRLLKLANTFKYSTSYSEQRIKKVKRETMFTCICCFISFCIDLWCTVDHFYFRVDTMIF